MLHSSFKKVALIAKVGIVAIDTPQGMITGIFVHARRQSVFLMAGYAESFGTYLK
jgi:hypothetical protein